MKTKVAIIAVLVSAVFGRTAAQIPEYDITDLGTLGGDVSEAYGINDQGQVVGFSVTTDNSLRAFLYSNGAMKNLGTLGTDFTTSRARGINNRSQVIGYSRTRGGQQYAFLYSNGAMLNLGMLIKGLDTNANGFSEPYGINDQGHVVGRFGIFGLSVRAFLYSDGSMKEIRAPASVNNVASGINNNGQVVGGSLIDAGAPAWRAFIYSDNAPLRILPTLGSDDCSARGVNDYGQVIGDLFNSAGKQRAFIYSDGVMQDLGTLGGNRTHAYGINNNGYVVGQSEDGRGSFEPFLYSNGLMRNLNNLIKTDSGWQLFIATAINNKGQIVGRGYEKSSQFSKPRAFLLNPISSQWKQAIETKPIQPTYSKPPKKEVVKNSLIVVTHGWQPAFLPVDIAWMETMTNAISRYLVNKGLVNWQVHAHRWVERAQTRNPKNAVLNAKEEGVSFAKYILEQRFTFVHIVSHSAGAGFSQKATETIKAARPDIVVHLTFLDPFVGFDYAGKTEYGKGANWAENYFSRDMLTSPIDHWFTEGPLDNAYNVDVTFLDPNKSETDVYRSTPNGALAHCYETRTSHAWPYEFYTKTIPPSAISGSGGFGFLLSEEASGLQQAMTKYGNRGNVPDSLGTPDTPCVNTLYVTTPSFIGEKMEFKDTSSIKSTTGTIKLDVWGLTLTTSSPIWVAQNTVITSRANFVSLEAEFTSASGAEGLLSVYWETNVIGSVDERATPAGIRQYRFPLPEVVASGSRVLGFRLDAFSAIQSSVTVTNVALGFAGVREPFSLSFVGTNANGPVLQLTGPSGYNYKLESSTNLVGWTPRAILENTNGVVRFVDSNTNNATARFYRAVAP